MWLAGEPLGDDARPRTGSAPGAWLDFDLLSVQQLAALRAANLDMRKPAAAAVAEKDGWTVLACPPAISPRDHGQQHVDEFASLLGEEVVVAERVLGVGMALQDSLLDEVL
jgi:hypothetical protein